MADRTGTNHIKTGSRPDRRLAGSRTHAFLRDESGSLVIFAVYIFVLMLMVGGIGIDLMRFERDRAKLQYTLDRAVLAAADLDQELEPQAVVEDYFAKSGLGNYLSTVTVSQGLGYRTVSASAKSTVQTQFMHMSGVDTLSVPANGTAEESIGDVEISLVLDVSGSMASNSKLTNLKSAAKEFIDTMVNSTEEGSVSMSIVPYATQVSVPESFLDRFNINRLHTYSNCVNFTAGDFYDTAITETEPLEQTMHFDPWNSSDRRPYNQYVSDPVCESAASRETMVMQEDATTLKNFITNFYAEGNTSIDVGMKWGVALLDPEMRPVINDMITDGEVPSNFVNRPNNFNSGDVLKVIVLMTDGQNTAQYYLKDGYGGVAVEDRDKVTYDPSKDYRTGNSNVWWNDTADRYSVHVGLDADDVDGDGVTDENLFYWPFNDSWQDHAYGNGNYTETTTYSVSTGVCQSYKKNGSCRQYETKEVTETNTYSETGSASLLSYADLWAKTPLYANARDNYAPFMGNSAARSDWYDGVYSYVDSTEKNQRVYDICNAAKDEGVIIFAIGFEAPDSGRTVLRKCASSDAHFYDVQGLEISDAFASIATSIRKLRLTQ
ncbi:pilus assembly protein [Albibacillus kandeliae]|uniref:pilus assembly protein n=1 Tax=Albibacillus kandeliae TaxID=2174228 RepID=UPI001E34C62E|nr:pilus assembly protein [Albibacillus kandeliae]